MIQNKQRFIPLRDLLGMEIESGNRLSYDYKQSMAAVYDLIDEYPLKFTKARELDKSVREQYDFHPHLSLIEIIYE